jgi:hypothetical protein
VLSVAVRPFLIIKSERLFTPLRQQRCGSCAFARPRPEETNRSAERAYEWKHSDYQLTESCSRPRKRSEELIKILLPFGDDLTLLVYRLTTRNAASCIIRSIALNRCITLSNRKAFCYSLPPTLLTQCEKRNSPPARHNRWHSGAKSL